MAVTVFDTTGAAVSRVIFPTKSLVIGFVLQVETIGTESLTNDPTAIVVCSVLVVFSGSTCKEIVTMHKEGEYSKVGSLKNVYV